MVLVRPYRVEELPLVLRRGLASAWDQLVDRELGWAQPDAMGRQFHEMYRAVLSAPGGNLLVAELPSPPEPGPVGHALLFPQPNPFTGVREVVVMDIWVHPFLRGRSIGSRLLQEAEMYARILGARGLAAQISLHNQASLALFRRAGFRQERVVVGRGW